MFSQNLFLWCQNHFSWNRNNEYKKWVKQKQQMKINWQRFPRCTSLAKDHEWKQVSVWLCGRSWGFKTIWHVFCLGDLGQWSTSGTSHNRVHISAAIRHPARQVVREREARAKKHLGFLSVCYTHTHAHTHAVFGILGFLGLLGFLQVHLDRKEQEWVHMSVWEW